MVRIGSLNHEQARHFRNEGYYRLLNAFTKEETKELRDFVTSEANSAKIDPKNPNKKIYGLYDRDPELMKRVIAKKSLIAALISIAGPNVVFVKNRHNHATINNKLGEPAEGMHRDILQPTRGLITAAVYLQDSVPENGATRIIPGSHEWPYVGVPQLNGGGTWMDEHGEYEGLQDQAIPVPMPEGSVLLFNGLIFHGVGHNASGEPRISITLGYRSADELDALPDDSRQILVSGSYIYRGNDVPA